MQTLQSSSFGNAPHSHPSSPLNATRGWSRVPGSLCFRSPDVATETPPFVASAGGRLLLWRWERWGKKPVPSDRDLLGVSRSSGSHLHPAGKRSRQHPATKAMFNHCVTHAVLGQAQADPLPFCRA